MTPPSHRNYCLNCQSAFDQLPTDAKEIFCRHCGQSSKESRLSMWQLLKDGVSNVFNLDSRLVHTFRDIFFPAKLTSTYIAGKRKYYVNPARLFVFMLIALVSLLLLLIQVENQMLGIDKFYSEAEVSKLKDSYTSLIDTLDTDGHEAILDTISKRLFKGVTTIDQDTIGESFVNIGLGKSIDEYGISSYDAIHLRTDSLFHKYEVTGFWNQLNVAQYIKIMNNPAGGIYYLIKNFTWVVILTILLMAAFLKLLYIRNGYYLVEHAVLLLNTHSLLFFILIINLCLLQMAEYLKTDNSIRFTILSLSAGAIFILQFLTLKKYYQQGILKTLVKQGLINFLYVGILILCFMLVAVVSVFLY